MPAERLESLFVVRHHILDNLMSSVEELGATPSPHHTLLVGPRGSGKTHLISLVYHRSAHLVEQGRCERLRIAWLPEDPWTIVSYSRLLAAILERLSPDAELNGVDEAELDARLRITSREDGPILVLMENVDRILEALGDLGQQRFRNLLQTESGILIIGSTTVLDRTLSDHAYPFFGFFDTIRLKPFSPAQARDMLRALAKESGNEDLANALEGDGARARIHTIAHLAGGQPRLWALLGSALTVDELNDLTNLLLNRFDDLTPFFQEQLARLSPQQRLVVAELAAADRPLAVKELAGRIGADQRSAAKTVSDLTDRGWLEPVSTIFANLLDRRRTYYELAEPLARLAFQIKESRGEPLPLIIDFLVSWFDADQLRSSNGGDYGQAALARMERDEVVDLARQLTSLPNSHIHSLDLLGRVEDALASVSDGDAEPVMSLPSALRQAIEYRADSPHDLIPIRLSLLYLALEDVGDIPRHEFSDKWLARARRLDAEVGLPTSRLMLVCWLSASWLFDESEEALSTIALEDERMEGTDALASAYHSAGIFARAIALFEHNLTDRQRILGPDHPQTLAARGGLAGALLDVGRTEQAIEMLRSLLEDYIRTMGPNHPHTLATRGRLAYALLETGNAEQTTRATDMLRDLLKDQKHLLGPNHPHTLATRGRLAYALLETGNAEQTTRATDMLRDLLKDQKHLLGPNHPQTIMTRVNLAGLDAGYSTDALCDLLEKQMRILVLGSDSPRFSASPRSNLIRAWAEAWSEGRFSDSRIFLPVVQRRQNITDILPDGDRQQNYILAPAPTH